jgi:hypothetical protein
MATLKKYFGIYLFILITVLASVAYFREQQEKKYILYNGIYKKAKVTYVSFIKNDWLLNITYTLDNHIIRLESIGTSKRHFVGDSITIKVRPHGRQKTAVIID